MKYIIRLLSLIIFLLLFTGCSTSKVYSKYLFLSQGDLPILINVSHDGNLGFKYLPVRSDSSDNFNNKNDLNTRVIGQLFNENIHMITGRYPSLVINNVHRKYIDINRKPSEAFESYRTKLIYKHYHKVLKNEIHRLLNIHDFIVLLDIHGFSDEKLDFVLSTRGNSTIRREYYFLINDILSELSNNGYKIAHDKPFYGGFVLKSINNIFGNKKVAAIQLEFGSNIRFKKAAREESVYEISKILTSSLDY